MTLVKNLKGTSGKTCKCGSWLDHWKKNSNGIAIPSYCVASGCYKSVEVGGHVKKVGIGDDNSYIIPICQSHNMTDANFEVTDTYFVSAAKSKTCDQ